MQVKIYHLTNPDNGQIFYVGATIRSLAVRQLGHCTNGLTVTCKNLYKEKKMPIITEIETCHIDQASERESFWIKQMKLAGYPIENKTEISHYTKQYYTRIKPKPPKEKPKSIYDEFIHQREIIKTMGLTKAELEKVRLSGKVRYYTILLGRPRHCYHKAQLESFLTAKQ